MNYYEKINIYLAFTLCLLVATLFMNEATYSHDIPPPDAANPILVDHVDLYDDDGNFLAHIHNYQTSTYTQAEVDEIHANNPHTAPSVIDNLPKVGDTSGVRQSTYGNPGFLEPDNIDNEHENYGIVGNPPTTNNSQENLNSQDTSDTPDDDQNSQDTSDTPDGQSNTPRGNGIPLTVDTQNQQSIENQPEQTGTQPQQEEYVNVVRDPHPDRIPQLQEGQVYFDSQTDQLYRIQNGQAQPITGQLYVLEDRNGEQVPVPVDTIQPSGTTYMILPSLDTAAAPTVIGNLKLGTVQIDVIEEQIDLLIATGDRSPAAMRKLIYLQQLLAIARPEKTQLFANYPNPFNPETWIPYELATDTDVRITIYNAQGVVIRTLRLGQQSAGDYTVRERAAYWDGRNAFGEQVASGIYFYQLETDTMSALRKMVIVK